MRNHILNELNSNIREQTSTLSKAVSDLTEQLAEARRTNEASRASRHAALNLMEDALLACEEKDRENAERLKVEAELRNSEAKFRSLFESIDEGFLLLEREQAHASKPVDFRVLDSNPASNSQSGLVIHRGSLISSYVSNKNHHCIAVFDQVLKTGIPVRFEADFTPGGPVLELYAFHPNEAKSTHLGVIFKNISDRKNAERILLETDRRKDEFLAILAHELRNPLAPIRNSLQVLRMTTPSDPMSKGLFDMMDRQVAHMVRLIDDLMEVSRITRGIIELQLKCVDIKTIINDAVEASQPIIASFGHELVIDLPTTSFLMNCDLVRLSQVFSNLLINAAKYTDRGGKICLAVTREQDDAVISVRDNGIGISPEMLKEIFELFRQVDDSRSRSRGGLGIGLTLVKRLVEMHHGTITAKSDGDGLGSEFIVRLPMAEKAAVSDGPVENYGLSKSSFRTLVVDDNADAATSLATLLRVLGNDVRIANSGEDALKVVDSFKPQIVFLDLGMPKMDGFQVAARIRELKSEGSPKLIALTGWGQPQDKVLTKDAGFVHHLVKPATIESLQKILSETAK